MLPAGAGVSKKESALVRHCADSHNRQPLRQARLAESEEDQTMGETTSIQPGRYRHYKGSEYTVLGTARHSETLEELVVYRQEYGEHGLWARPRQMFTETVKVDGQDVPRFRHLGPSSAQIAESVKNIFDDLPEHLPKEVIQTLIRAADVRIERIISQGHASPAGFWYDQPQHEWVIVLKGAARLQFEDGMVEMDAGDFLNIPAFKKHRVDWTTPDEPTIWLGMRYGAQT